MKKLISSGIQQLKQINEKDGKVGSVTLISTIDGTERNFQRWCFCLYRYVAIN